jgi:hypothetical protein
MQGPVSKILRVAWSVGLLTFLGGCLLGVRTGEVQVLPLVGDYEHLALVGLEEESEAFREAFPDVEFASRQDVLELYPEEELYTGRLPRTTGDQLRSSLGVEGVVSLVWDDSGMGGTLDWRMIITDTESGQITATAVARVRRESLARGASFQDLERKAFGALVDVLKERLNR